MKKTSTGKIVLTVIGLLACLIVGYLASFWECDRCREKVRGKKYEYVNSGSTICEDCYQFLKTTGQIYDVN